MVDRRDPGSILTTDSTRRWALPTARSGGCGPRWTWTPGAGTGGAVLHVGDDTHDHTAVSWTQLGSTVTARWDDVGVLRLGGGVVGILADGSAPFTGKVYGAAILSGIGGRWWPTRTSPTGTGSFGALGREDAAGRTWTVSSPASLVAVTYDLFSGFVDTWPQSHAQFMGMSEMTATDGFKILSRVDISGAYGRGSRGQSPWDGGASTMTRRPTDLCTDSSGNGRDRRYRGSP